QRAVAEPGAHAARTARPVGPELLALVSRERLVEADRVGEMSRQAQAEDLEDLVVHDGKALEHVGEHGAALLRLHLHDGSPSAGKETPKSVPLPITLSTPMCPPCASMIW